MFPSVLCLLSDVAWCDKLREAASGDKAAKIVFSDRDNAAQAIENTDFDVLLLDLFIALDRRLDLISKAERHRPRALLGVVAAPECDEDFGRLPLRRLRLILSIVPPPARRLRLLFEGLASPDAALGLEKYLSMDASIEETRIVRWSDKERVIDQAIADARRQPFARPSEFDIRLALEEMINNAVSHAFKTAGGAEKYRLSEIVELEEGDVVTARHSVGPTWIGLSVSDNQGALDLEDMMWKFHRQLSRQGMTDEDGRGIFLTRAFSDALIVACVPGQTTEVIALFDAESAGADKSFCVCAP
jgi:anti-sigma regulatory factor (Ser/Thr protein kinase)